MYQYKTKEIKNICTTQKKIENTSILWYFIRLLHHILKAKIVVFTPPHLFYNTS